MLDDVVCPVAVERIDAVSECNLELDSDLDSDLALDLELDFEKGFRGMLMNRLIGLELCWMVVSDAIRIARSSMSFGRSDPEGWISLFFSP